MAYFLKRLIILVMRTCVIAAANVTDDVKCHDNPGCIAYNLPDECSSAFDPWPREHCLVSCKLCVYQQVSVAPGDNLNNNCQDLFPGCRDVIYPCHHDATLQKHCPKTCGTCDATELLKEPDVKCHDNPGCIAYNLPDECSSAFDPWPRKHCLVSCKLCVYQQVSVAPGDNLNNNCQDLFPGCRDVIYPCHHDATLQKHCPKTCGTCDATELLKEPDDVKCHDNPGCIAYNLPDECSSAFDPWPREHCLVSCKLCVYQQVSVAPGDNRKCHDLFPECLEVQYPCHHDATLQKHCPKTCGTCHDTDLLQEPDDVKCHDNPGCIAYNLPEDCSLAFDIWPRKHCLVSCKLCLQQVSSVTDDSETENEVYQSSGIRTSTITHLHVSEDNIRGCKDKVGCEQKNLPNECSSEEIKQLCPASCDMCPKIYLLASELGEKIEYITIPDVSKQLQTNTISLHQTRPTGSSEDAIYAQKYAGIDPSPGHLIDKTTLSSNTGRILAVIIGFIVIAFVIIVAYYLKRKKDDKSYHRKIDARTMSPVIDLSPLLTHNAIATSSASESILSPIFSQAQALQNGNNFPEVQTALLPRATKTSPEISNEEVSLEHNEPSYACDDSQYQAGRISREIWVNQDGLIYPKLDFSHVKLQRCRPPVCKGSEYITINFSKTVGFQEAETS